MRAHLSQQMRTHIVIWISLEQEADLLLVAYSHSLFQTSIILFDLSLVPVTVQLTPVFLTSFIFFCKKANVITK